MPIKPRDFLDQSHELLKGNAEVDYRSAVSRSYYCALHCCIELCDQFPGGFKDDASTTHQSVIRQLFNCPSGKPFRALRADMEALARQLRKGRNERVRADYKLDGTVTRNKAKQHVASMATIKIRTEQLLEKLSTRKSRSA